MTRKIILGADEISISEFFAIMCVQYPYIIVYFILKEKFMVHVKSSRIEIRTNPEIKQIIEKAARIKGKTISEYILGQSLSSARKDIEQMESITVSNKDRDMFYSLLTNSPFPNNALKNLMQSDSF